MILPYLEALLRWTGAGLTLVTLAAIFYGLWRGTTQPSGRQIGFTPGILRSPLFYLAASVIFFGFCILLWKPLPLLLPIFYRVVALVVGSLLFFPGMASVLLARLALGRMYFTSTSFGAQLFAGHRLITHGLYAVVRHPMYTGLSLAAVGGLLLYQTWTTVFLLLLPFGLVRRARREEQVLADQFGDQWQEYYRRVPMFFPRFKKGKS